MIDVTMNIPHFIIYSIRPEFIIPLTRNLAFNGVALRSNGFTGSRFFRTATYYGMIVGQVKYPKRVVDLTDKSYEETLDFFIKHIPRVSAQL